MLKLKEVLEKGILKEKPMPGLIVHSDKGSQMRAKIFRNTVITNGFINSYTSLGHSCDENAMQESFHASLKKEWLYCMKLTSFEQANKKIGEYIKYYNRRRLHSSLNMMSPDEFARLASSKKSA